MEVTYHVTYMKAESNMDRCNPYVSIYTKEIYIWIHPILLDNWDISRCVPKTLIKLGEDTEYYYDLFGRLAQGGIVPFDQYHEPFDKLPEETRTFARLIMSLIEEAEAINWYEQRMAVEADAEARQVMSHAQKEEFIHFGMDLEFLLRRNPTWQTVLKNILFKKGDLVDLAEHSEEKIEDD